jgi:hypothetical protein
MREKMRFSETFRSAIVFTLLATSAFAGPVPVFGEGAAPSPVAPRSAGGANLGSAQLTAEFNANGTLITGKGLSACAETDGTCRNAVGKYIVHFARDISGCTAVTSRGGRGGFNQVGWSSAAIGNTNPTLVYETVLNSSGSPVDGPFSLIVIC